MAEVDSLEIQIQSTINDVNKDLDALVSKLGLVTKGLSAIKNNKGLEEFAKQTESMSKSMESVQSKAKEMAKALDEPMKKVSKSLEQIKIDSKDIGKGFRVEGGLSSVQKALQKYKNELEKVKLKEQTLSAKGKTNTQGYRDAIVDIQKYSNIIESLQSQIEEMRSIKPEIKVKIHGLEETEKVMDSIEKKAEEIKTVFVSQNSMNYNTEAMVATFGEGASDIKNWSQAVEKFGSQAGMVMNQFSIKSKASIEEINKKIDELQDKFKNAGTDFKFSGNISQINNEIDKASSKLSRFLEKEKEMIYAGDIDTSAFENLEKDIVESSNIKAYLEELKDKTESFNQSLQQLQVPDIQEENLDKLQSNLKKTEGELDKLKIKLKNSLNIGDITENVEDKGYRNLQEQIALTEKTAEKLKEKIQSVSAQSNQFDELAGSISNAEQMLNKFAIVLGAVGLGKYSSGIKAISKMFGQASSAANSFGQKLSETGEKASAASGKASAAIGGIVAKIGAASSSIPVVGIAIAAVIAGITLKVKALQMELKAVGTVAKTVANVFTTVWKTVGNVAKSILTIGTSGHKAITPIGKFVDKLINLFKTRILRTAITKALEYVSEGIENLNLYSYNMGTSFHKNMTLIYSDLKLLGRTIATAFQPILTIATPILDFLIKKVIDVINVVNQLISSFTGKTYTKAIPYIEEYGDALSDAADSAQKLNKQIRSFDELNVISNPNASSGAGGAGAVDTSAMFKEEDIPQNILDFKEKLLEAWEKSDFTEIGEFLGRKISDALNSINWDGIQEKASNIGKNFATLINGIISTPFLAEDIGVTIGEYTNTFIDIFDGFVKNIDFSKIGTSIGVGIKSAIQTIDFDTLIGDMSALGTGIADAINALIGTGALSDISIATANFLRAGISGAFSLIENFDFASAGVKISNAINSFFETMSEVDPETGLNAWEELGTGITDLANGLTQMIVNAFSDIDEDEIGNAFEDFLSGISWTDIILDLGILVTTLEKAFWSAIWEALSNAIEDVFSKIWDNIEISSDWIVETVGDAVKNAWDNAKKWWETKKESLSDISVKVEDFKTKVQTAWNNVKSYWSSKPGLANITANVEDIRTKVVNAWNNIRSYWNSKPALSSISANVSNILTSVKNAWSQVVSWWNNNKPSLSAITANIKLPHISIVWETTTARAKMLQKLGLNGFPNFNVAYYAQGGFPEDGWFRASHGEIMGKFDNGQSVVANNEQITQGIADAVYPAVYNAVVAAMNNSNGGTNVTFQVEGDPNGLFKVVQKESYNYFRRTGNPAFSQ